MTFGPPNHLRAIEESFPVVFVSQLAQRESWRKEVFRPLSYVHKWWAKRLGSVFRSLLIASCENAGADVSSEFWQPAVYPDVTVFDPFMGSGTTVYEAVKLGCQVIGRDINPVSYAMVRSALQPYALEEVREEFARISATAGKQIRGLYTSQDAHGEQCDVLYYFWVKSIPCPLCHKSIDLFKSRIFARHAYPKEHPESKSVCPACYAINDVRYDDEKTKCPQCSAVYNPQMGTLANSKVTCPDCGSSFNVLAAVRKNGVPIKHRMYAKLILRKDGQKEFRKIESFDERMYQKAEEMLPRFWEHIPQERILPGHNTNQVLNYNYQHWHQMFNARQLVSLALLSSEIAPIEKDEIRRLFACLFSGILEFNNMFATFKGLGTGAVRHMFYHHILKPEFMPLEANPWGTDQSSGSFSTLFESRILRALEYKANPFELGPGSAATEKSRKFFDISRPINVDTCGNFEEFVRGKGKKVYISCGDSSSTDIKDGTVDLILTDPPFFDNVHYSELADFFFVWLRRILRSESEFSSITTRSPLEVQNVDVDAFTEQLGHVFRECHRVLKHDGLLVFTYHHSRTEGWIAVYKALNLAGFVIERTYPVKSEMAVAVPIQESKSPISFDLVIVCQKSECSTPLSHTADPLEACLVESRAMIHDLRNEFKEITEGDAKIILMGCLLSKLPGEGDLLHQLEIIRSVGQNGNGWIKDAMGPGSTRKGHSEGAAQQGHAKGETAKQLPLSMFNES